MNEQIMQELVADLGNTIAQQSIDMALLKATNRELQRELERVNAELSVYKQKEAEEAKGVESVE